MASEQYRSRIPGFYRLSLESRRQTLQKQLGLLPETLSAFLPEEGLDLSHADRMVENALGVFGLPLGVAVNFLVDDIPVVVPMAVEEPSIIAACSNVARLVGLSGGFRTEVDPPHMIGQLQLVRVLDTDRALHAIETHREEIIAEVNRFCPNMIARGGGCLDVKARVLPPIKDGYHGSLDNDEVMIAIDVILHCGDAMGANIVNTALEGVAPKIEELTGARVSLRILSNLADRRLARAFCEVPYRYLATDASKDSGRDIALAVVGAYRFAARDVYRACTHNKGILNGIDALAIATGNDWRAIEAGAHAYAAREGRYTSLTRYSLDDAKQVLCASIELPIAAGVVGGSTRAHPSVKAALALIGPFGESARSLARLMASVGLAQNMSALWALVSEGIQRGHLELHRRKNGAGA
jgi:hydroxymethylglutaryl-CoA reductase